MIVMRESDELDFITVHMKQVIGLILDLASCIVTFEGGIGEEMCRHNLFAYTQQPHHQTPVEKALFDDLVWDLPGFKFPAFFIEFYACFDGLWLYLSGYWHEEFICEFLLLVTLHGQSKETAAVVLTIECILFGEDVLFLCA